MRLAYFAQISGAPSSGVMHKVRAQTEEWAARGHDVRLFLLTRDEPGTWMTRFPKSVVHRYTGPLSRARSMTALVRAVRAHRPDLIYQRFFAFYPTMLALPRKVPVVVEVNTDDTTEYALMGGFRATYNRHTRGLVLGPARALVFVTSELSRRPGFRHYRGRHVVIPNGVSLRDYPELPAPAGERPRLVLVGSAGQPWQGFDKLVRLATLRPAWDFDVVGARAEGQAPPNIEWHGPLDRASVLGILARADVGVGTLALHRKDLDEASPLKVREYLAVGLPVVYAHQDPDADLLDSGALRIANSESNIEDEIERIDAFVNGMRGRRVPRTAVAHIDYAQKEAQRLALFEELVVVTGSRPTTES